MAENIRIMLVDDHPVVRDGLAAMLSTQADFEVVAQAGSGPEAVALVAGARPDVVLIDLEMPGVDGVETIRRLRTAHPDLAAIAFTAYDTDELIVGAVQAGARGYLLKGAPRDQIFQAIRAVHEGGSLLQPGVAAKLLRHVQAPAATVEPLTERELQVLRLLARGRTNREIAAELVITERTAKFHVSSLLGKLGAGNRTEAVTVAAQRGLIDL